MQFILHTDSIRLVNSAVGRRDTKLEAVAVDDASLT